MRFELLVGILVSAKHRAGSLIDLAFVCYISHTFLQTLRIIILTDTLSMAYKLCVHMIVIGKAKNDYHQLHVQQFLPTHCNVYLKLSEKQ